MKDLTNSIALRHNILNNNYALEEIKKAVGVDGIMFENQYRFLKTQIATFFEIDELTVERCLDSNEKELNVNGYEVLEGKRLEMFRLAVDGLALSGIHVTQLTAKLGVFNFRAFLNFGMLLTESDKAKVLRSIILDVLLDTINEQTGGSTKYINQGDENFVLSYNKDESNSKEFISALSNYVAMGNAKYAIYINKVYQSIFGEYAAEYRQKLKLCDKDNMRATMYSEILNLILSYECGLAKLIEKQYDEFNRSLTSFELDNLFFAFEKSPLCVFVIEKVRKKIASRNLTFRDVLNLQVEEYIATVPFESFELFLSEKSKELAGILEETQDVFKRLKER